MHVGCASLVGSLGLDFGLLYLDFGLFLLKNIGGFEFELWLIALFLELLGWIIRLSVYVISSIDLRHTSSIAL